MPSSVGAIGGPYCLHEEITLKFIGFFNYLLSFEPLWERLSQMVERDTTATFNVIY